MSVIMEKIIPDFQEIAEIFSGMVAQHQEDTAHVEDQTKTSVRKPFCIAPHVIYCRSLLVLLGVLYKYQKRTKTRELENLSSNQDDLCQEQLHNIVF